MWGNKSILPWGRGGGQADEAAAAPAAATPHAGGAGDAGGGGGGDDDDRTSTTSETALSTAATHTTAATTGGGGQPQQHQPSIGAAASAAAAADSQRATHQIRLSSLRHNYRIVEDAASRQRCSVIVVVKADGYGHGAVETAVHLADYCGAGSFAVATLEEGIALRRALSMPAGTDLGAVTAAAAAAAAAAGAGGVEFGLVPGGPAGGGAAGPPPGRQSSGLAPSGGGGAGVVGAGGAAGGGVGFRTVPAIGPGLFVPPPSAAQRQQQRRRRLSRPSSSSSSPPPSSPSPPSSPPPSVVDVTPVGHSNAAPAAAAGSNSPLPPINRSPRIRILVLGPPVGYPRSFDLYLHHGIELMISGPEVARALMDWVGDAEGRRRTEVERAAAEFMGEAMARHVGMVRVGLKGVGKGALDEDDDDEEAEDGHDDDENDANQGDREGEEDWRGGEYCGGTGDDEKKDDAVNSPAAAPTKRGGKGNVKGNGNGKPPEGTTPDKKKKKAPSRQLTPPPPDAVRHASSTLSNVTGDGLAREVRAILLNQQAVAARAAAGVGGAGQQQQQQQPKTAPGAKDSGGGDAAAGSGGEPASSGPPPPSSSSVAASSSALHSDHVKSSRTTAAAAANSGGGASTTTGGGGDRPNPPPISGGGGGAGGATAAGAGAVPFRGIEDAAKLSRDRELASRARSRQVEAEEEADDGGDDVVVVNDPTALASGGAGGAVPLSSRMAANGGISPTLAGQQQQQPPTQARKRLRWHALVDSGMGRLGFKPDPTPDGEGDGGATDGCVSVALIKALHDAEVRDNAPIEFYGMCTHMADANSKSSYTQSQMERFLTLLDNVRKAGISVPTVSTDNSAALLTTSLTHFDPVRILSQPGADSRGYVRTGGAIFGQRPSFPQLRAISTLTASVRHVAVIKEGDSVGYDRAYTAPMDVRIATLTIGFADGYPRELGNGVGKVSIRGRVFPVAGNVCMDMMMVELGPSGDLSGVGAHVTVGDVAIIWGPDGPDDDGDGLVRLQDIAATLKTTQSALTCGLNKARVRREYI